MIIMPIPMLLPTLSNSHARCSETVRLTCLPDLKGAVTACAEVCVNDFRHAYILTYRPCRHSTIIRFCPLTDMPLIPKDSELKSSVEVETLRWCEYDIYTSLRKLK